MGWHMRSVKTKPAKAWTLEEAVVLQEGMAVAMTPPFLQAARTRLVKRRAMLLRTHLDTRDHESEIAVAPDPMDFGDRATRQEEITRLYHLDDAELDELQAIASSLARLDSGTYGACVTCGRRVGRGRLRAVPLTLLCISCARKSERPNTWDGPRPTART